VRALKRFIGYLLFFVISLVPALIAYFLDAGSNEVGLIYLGTILWATMVWGAVHARGILRYVLFVLLAALPMAAGIVYAAPTGTLVQLYFVALAWVFAFWGLFELISRNESQY